MRNRRLNDGYRFGPSLCAPSTKKKHSKIMKKSCKEWRRSIEYFRTSMPNRNNYASERGNDIAKQSRLRSSQIYDSSKLASVNGQQNKIVTQKMRQIPSDDLTNAKVAHQPNGLERPSSSRQNSGSSRPNDGMFSPQWNTETSRPSSLRPSNGMVSLQRNTKKYMPSSLRPVNGEVAMQRSIETSRPSCSRPTNGIVSSQRHIETFRPSSLSPENGIISPERNTQKSKPSAPSPNNGMVTPHWKMEKSSRPDNALFSPQKNMEKSRPSSSRSDNASVSLQKNFKKSRLFSPRSDNASVSLQKDTKKSRLFSSRPDNASVSPQKDIKKSRPDSASVSSQKDTKKSRLFSSRLNNALVSPQKDIEKSRHISSMQNNGLVSPQKNIEKSSPSQFTDGFFSRKLEHPDSARLKDDSNLTLGSLKKSHSSLVVRNWGYTEQAVSSEVHEQDLRMAKEALNSILDLKGKVIQDFQCNLGNNSSRIFGKNLSSHQMAQASCMGIHMEQNGKSLDGCIQLDSRNQNTSLAEDSRIDGDMFKSKRKGPFLEEKPETHEKNGGEEAGNFRPTKRRRYIAIEDEEDDGGDQNLVGVDCGIEEAESCRLTKKRRRYILNEDEEDDGGDQNLAGVEGGSAGLITQAAIMKDQRTEVSEPFISDSGKLQHYSCLPIDEPIWSGILKVGSKEYISLAAHLSAKCCERAWKLSRSLKQVVEVTKLSRLEAWPKSFEVSRPTDDNIALYFLPQELRLDEDLDQLVKEVTENDRVLRAVVCETEMLIFPSILLPEQHQTFQRKPYLWGVFKRREDKVAIVEEEQHCTGRCAQEEEIEKQSASNSGVQKDGYRVAGLNMAAGLGALKEAGRQGMEQELTPLLARPNTPHLAEGVARPTSAPTTAAVLPHSTLAVPSGAVFGFVGRQTPRLEKLIQEMEHAGSVVVAMRGEMIASGLGQPTATR